MRKIALLTLIVILGTMAFAAAPKTAPAARPAANPAPAVSSAAGTGPIIGVEDGSPYMRFVLNRDQSIDVGLTYNNTNSNNNSITVMGRLNNKIGQVGAVTTSWGAALTLTSGKAGVDFTVIGLVGSVSAGYMILENVEIYGNINLLALANTSAGGTSTTSYNLITGSGNCYSGIRVYL